MCRRASSAMMKWKQLPRYWSFVKGIHRSPVDSTHEGQWHEALMFSLICAWSNSWTINRDAGDLRRHRAYYLLSWPHFYQTRSAWSVDQGSNKNHSPAYNFAPTVTKFCVMWEGLSLPHDTKFGNCRCKIVDRRSFPSWSLIHGLRWSGLIKVGPGEVIMPAMGAWTYVNNGCYHN